MSIGLENLVNVTGVSSDYPWKDIKDDTGAGDGTPLDQISHSDYHQTFRKLLDLAGIIPNGLPDNVTNGYQYVDAILSLAKRSNGVLTVATGQTLTRADVRKIIFTEAPVALITHTLPLSSTLQDGDSFIFFSNSTFNVVIQAGGSDSVMLGADITLLQRGDFVELVLDKPNNNWVIANYKITVPPASPIPSPVYVYKNGGSIGSGTDLIVPFNTAVYDADTLFNLTTHKYKAPKAGYYRFKTMGYIYNNSSASTPTIAFMIYKNGTPASQLVFQRNTFEVITFDGTDATAYEFNGEIILLSAVNDEFSFNLVSSPSQSLSIGFVPFFIDYVNQP